MISKDVTTIELSDFDASSTAILIKMYSELAVPLDRLPYTPALTCLYNCFITKSHLKVQEGHLYHILIKFRKRGLLPRLRKEE